VVKNDVKTIKINKLNECNISKLLTSADLQDIKKIDPIVRISGS